MGAASGITGGIGGLCTVMGIITAADIVKPVMTEFTWMFWFVLAALLLLASIAFALARSTYE